MTFLSGDFETEDLFFKDYFQFGIKRYEFFVNIMKEKFAMNKNINERKLLFIEINSFLSKTLEDFGIHIFALYKARKDNISLIRTLVTYRGDGNISELIKNKNDKEVELMFGLNNIYKKKFRIDVKERRNFIKTFIKNIKSMAALQKNNHKIYNRAKHGNIIVSSIKAIRTDSTEKRDSIAVLNDNPLFPNVAPFSEEIFLAMCENILILSGLIKEIILVYLGKYNPEALKKISFKI